MNLSADQQHLPGRHILAAVQALGVAVSTEPDDTISANAMPVESAQPTVATVTESAENRTNFLQDNGRVSAERRVPAIRKAAEPLAAIRRGVVVLGMHRGGTSAVSGVLAGAGFTMGIDEGSDVMQPDDDNPRGYFERFSTADANDALLSSAGGSWDQPPGRDTLVVTSDTARRSVNQVMDRLLSESSSAPLLVKDPRIPVLLPVWDHVVGSTLLPVLVVRHPLESAQSLANRNTMQISAGLALWEMTWRGILEALDGMTAYAVRFDRMLADPNCAQDLITWVRGQLPTELAEQVTVTTTSPPQSAFHRNRAADRDLEGYATAAQLELWQRIQELGEGQVVVAGRGLPPISAGCLLTLRRDAEVRARLERLNGDAGAVAGLQNQLADVCNALNDQVALVRELRQELRTTKDERNEVAARMSALETAALDSSADVVSA